MRIKAYWGQYWDALILRKWALGILEALWCWDSGFRRMLRFGSKVLPRFGIR